MDYPRKTIDYDLKAKYSVVASVQYFELATVPAANSEGAV